MNYFFVIQIEDEFEDDEVVEEDKLEEVGDEDEDDKVDFMFIYYFLLDWCFICQSYDFCFLFYITYCILFFFFNIKVRCEILKFIKKEKIGKKRKIIKIILI